VGILGMGVGRRAPIAPEQLVSSFEFGAPAVFPKLVPLVYGLVPCATQYARVA